MSTNYEDPHNFLFLFFSTSCSCQVQIFSVRCVGYYTRTIRPDRISLKSTHHIHICVVIKNGISISVIYFLSVYDLHGVITADRSPSCFINPNKAQSHCHLAVRSSIPVSFT